MKVEFHDYYGVLGVPRDASPEAIRAAYRKLARKQHPDVDKSAGATERFQRINEAHEVLKDPEKRARYDRLGSRWKEGDPFEAPMGHGGGFRGREQTFEGFDGFSSFFESLFADAPPDLGRGRRGRGRRARGVELEVELTLEEVLDGASRSIERRVRGGGLTARRVQIPPGVADGQLLELPGDEHGDVVRLVVRVAPHPRFRVDGSDLDADLPVTPWEAALGGRVTLRGLDGSELALNLPAGGESRRLRLRGQGLPRPDGTRGDLRVQARIVVPSSLSPEERRAFEELARVSRFRPRG